MSKFSRSMFFLATAGAMLIGCGDGDKKVTGPVLEGIAEPIPVASESIANEPAAKVSAAGWSAAGPGAVSLVSDGTAGDPEMTYALHGSSVFSTQTWSFSALATGTGPITVDYDYRGFHAFFQVRAFLQAFVGGSAVSLISAGPANCCSSPSNGFGYTGSYTFNVTAGQTYGFRFGGSNFDSDSRLLGTFKLPNFTPPPPPADLTAPVITLNGPASQTLECHVGTYTEAGASAVDDRDGAVAVTPSGSVNSLAVGSYTITYTARDAAGNTVTATRTVTVVDTTPPAITLNGPASLTLECHLETYTEAGATATDLCDGAVPVVISGSVDADAEGTYTLTYTAKDGAGNTATATRTVKVVDTTPPAITLIGAASQTIECHVGTYTEAGATALDACDGAVTVAIDGSVDTTVEGTYTFTYTAADAAGNTATATRTVEVVDTTAPALTLSLSQTSLWPPNHAMVPVATISATDLCDALVGLQISVTSNEPENGTGDGDTGPDWEVVDNGDGTGTIALRAERKGNGTGRVYTLSVVATDEAGNFTAKGGKVTVVHSQAKKK